MPSGGQETIADDGTFELNDDGARVIDDKCPQQCGTVPGPLGIFPSGTLYGREFNFCVCCMPGSWDLVFAGTTSLGPIITLQEHWNTRCLVDGPSGERDTPVPLPDPPPDTIEGLSIDGTYSVEGPFYLLGKIAANVIYTWPNYWIEGHLGAGNSCGDCIGEVRPGDGDIVPGPACYHQYIVSQTLKCGIILWSGRFNYNTPDVPTSGIASYTLTAIAQSLINTYVGGGYLLFYGEHTFLPNSDGVIGWDCNTPITLNSVTPPFPSIRVLSGGTLTIKPCSSGSTFGKYVTCLDVALTNVCVTSFTTSTSSIGGIWAPWTVGSVRRLRSGDPFPEDVSAPKITYVGPGCTASINVITPFNGTNCEVAATPPLPTKKCYPPFLCARLWKSFHRTDGWTDPIVVAGQTAYCVSSNGDYPIDQWGPVDEDCASYFLMSLGSSCTGPDDHSSCASHTETIAPPPKPTFDPGCYAGDTVPSCAAHNCPDGKCDTYRFFVQKEEGTDELDRVGPSLYSPPEGVDCPTICDAGWRPDPVADRASVRDVSVCHGAAAPPWPADPESGDYS